MNNKFMLFILCILVMSGCKKEGPADDPQPKDLTVFAKCLSEKNTTMYGAEWCPHCQDQKKMFGDAFKYVNYVECSINDGNDMAQECKDAKITGYPTWIFADGQRKAGAVTFAGLARMSGCPLA